MQDALADTTTQAAAIIYQFRWIALNNTMPYLIAAVMGIFIILISYAFGGGSRNRAKIFFSIFLGVLIGVLTLPLLLRLAQPDEPMLVAFFVFIDLVFAAAVAVHFYELVVIGAHEALTGK